MSQNFQRIWTDGVCNFCEESDLMKTRCQKLSELDAKTAEMDKEWYTKRDPKTEEPAKIARYM